MQQQLSLNELHEQYRGGLLEKRQFESMLFGMLLENLCQYNTFGWKRDDCIDYLSWLYPRLSKAIDSYKEIGASFESYISALVHWSSREYVFRGTNRSAAEHAAWTARLPDMYVHGIEPDYPEYDSSSGDKPESEPEPKRAKNPRQLLILILKCYYYLSDDLLDRLAPRVGIEKEKLRELVDTLRRQRTERDEQIYLMKERIHSQFYRCIIYEERLKVTPKNSSKYLKLKEKTENARRRLETMKKRLAGIRLEATNLQIGNILGIPKGTVDSNLHALKTKMKKDK